MKTTISPLLATLAKNRKLRQALLRLTIAAEELATAQFFIDDLDDLRKTREAKAMDRALAKANEVLDETDPKRVKAGDTLPIVTQIITPRGPVPVRKA